MISDSELPMDIKPVLARGCRLRERDGEPASLQIPEGQIRMSGAGLEIIKLCDGDRTIGEIVYSLKEKYSAAESEKINSDTLSFLKRLNERAVLIFQ